uniref:NR LBD domain-containing protein n=1 Tax=Acrobeloides nanus TaxID=290746 RepID=A0A914EKY3_9BILA
MSSDESRLRDSPPLNPEEDWTKTLNWSNKQLLSDLLELDNEVKRASGTIAPDSVVKFSLKSFINERTLILHEGRAYQTNQKVSPSPDDPVTALHRIVEVVDWVNGLCRVALRYCEHGSITVEDKVAIVQNVFCRLVLLSMAAKGALCRENPTGYPFNNITEKSEFDLWLMEDFIPALKKLNPTQTEIFAFKAIITMDPSAKGIRPAASETITEFRNRLQELFAKLLKKGKVSSISPYAQFGNYLLLIPNLISISERLNETFRAKYPLNGGNETNELHIYILRDLFNPDTTDYLRFPQYSARKLSASAPSPNAGMNKVFEMSSNNIPKQRLPNTPPQIMINDQISGFEHYNWHLSTFASAFSNLQTTTGFSAPIITSDPKSPISLVNGFSPVFSSAENNASHLSPALPTQSMTPVENFMTTTGANSLYMNRFAIPNSAPSFYSTALGSQMMQPQTSRASQYPSTSNSRPNTLEIPASGVISESTQMQHGVIPKLPLQLTKSIEEMLRPAVPDDGSTWNKPLAKDWADKVSTPAFNREVVAKFFPECANSNI